MVINAPAKSKELVALLIISLELIVLFICWLTFQGLLSAVF